MSAMEDFEESGTPRAFDSFSLSERSRSLLPPSPGHGVTSDGLNSKVSSSQSARRARRVRSSVRTSVARVSRETLAEIAGLEPELCPQLQRLWDRGAEDSRRLAERYSSLAPFHAALDASDGDGDDFAAEVVGVALSLRCTNSVASSRIHEAHHAVTGLPQCFARLHNGEFPAEWFERLVRRSRFLNAANLTTVDDTVSAWPMNLTVTQFRTRLSALISRIQAREEISDHLTPEGGRRVELLAPGEDGMGCLQVTGPIPEILSLARRLDTTARAAQAAQRHAFETGEVPPVDPYGVVAETGTPSSLARLQYDLLMGAGFEPDGVHAPRERFRINVTVPVLSLLGASAEPGMLDGVTPIPAAMARDLAGDADIWYRVLTDPASGEFLPLPADRYRPSKQMLEHLRLRNATCAAPGCARTTSAASEADHIIEFNHQDPAQGGRTEIENLHLLCWQHHRLKTAGLLDPERVPRTRHETGQTLWTMHGRFRTRITDDTDIATPFAVAELKQSWEQFEQRRETQRGHEPPDVPYPPPPF